MNTLITRVETTITRRFIKKAAGYSYNDELINVTAQWSLKC